LVARPQFPNNQHDSGRNFKFSEHDCEISLPGMGNEINPMYLKKVPTYNILGPSIMTNILLNKFHRTEMP
jgi:hypothetical protein